MRVQGEKKPYRGKPQNQRDPNAILLPPVRKPQPPPKKREARGLNKPTKLHDTSHVKVSTTGPFEHSVFGTTLSVNEIGNRTPFTPSAPALIEISRSVYSELLTDEPNLAKTFLPEYLDYYSTALLWFRFISLKAKNANPLTDDESDIITILQTQIFAVPEPISIQLHSLGNIETMSGQHLYPEFPPIPTAVISGQPGFYGTLTPPGPGVDNSLHLLYEEIPCLGVLAHAVKQAVSNRPAGPYPSLVTYANQQPNANLLGYKNLSFRRNEAKNFALAHGITESSFRSYPPNCALNIEFLIAISNLLATTKTFKIEHIVFPTLTENGSQAQIVVTHPVPAQGQLNLHGEIRPDSVSKEKESTFGTSIYLVPNLFKVSLAANNHVGWCLFDTPPPEWVDNRNNRRNLPIQYKQRVFSTVSQHASAFRLHVTKQLVVQKR